MTSETKFSIPVITGILAVITGILALLVILFVFVAKPKKPSISEVEGTRIVTIDGCEYIDNVSYVGYHVYTHKGNCTNSIHRQENHGT